MLSKALGLFHSDHCKGIHVNYSAAQPQPYNPLHILQGINAFTPILDRIPLLLSSAEIQNLKDSKHWTSHESGEQCDACCVVCTSCLWQQAGRLSCVFPSALYAGVGEGGGGGPTAMSPLHCLVPPRLLV